MVKFTLSGSALASTATVSAVCLCVCLRDKGKKSPVG